MTTVQLRNLLQIAAKLPNKDGSGYYFLGTNVSCWSYLRDFNITNSSYPGEKIQQSNWCLF